MHLPFLIVDLFYFFLPAEPLRRGDLLASIGKLAGERVKQRLQQAVFR